MSGIVNKDPQQQIQAARQLLRQQGLRVTSDNLNRAMQMLYSEQNTSDDTIERINRTINRTIGASPPQRAATRRAATQPATQVPVRLNAGDNVPITQPPNMGTPVDVGDNAADYVKPVKTSNANTAANTTAITDAAADVTANITNTRGQRVSETNRTNNRRAGAVNAAQRFDDSDEAAANPNQTLAAFNSAGSAALPRQADETGIDPISLAIALGIPLAAVGGAAGMAMSPMARASVAQMMPGASPGYIASQGVNAARNNAVIGNSAVNRGNVAAGRLAAHLRRQGLNAKPKTQRMQRVPAKDYE